MKTIALLLLSLYQKAISPMLHRILGIQKGQGCRYLPTCSEYARIHITKDGVIKGSAKTFLRILYCQPFAKNLPTALRT